MSACRQLCQLSGKAFSITCGEEPAAARTIRVFDRPWWSGKTTVGPLLAQLIDASFVDLDEEFCERIAPIRRYLDEHGYAAYIRQNASLFRTLLRETEPHSKTVFALSSGFLATNVEAEVVSQNRTLVMQQGTAVLLMPSEDVIECTRMIVERQLRRGLGLHRESQKQRH